MSGRVGLQLNVVESSSTIGRPQAGHERAPIRTGTDSMRPALGYEPSTKEKRVLASLDTTWAGSSGLFGQV
jgi:hypothetical protein